MSCINTVLYFLYHIQILDFTLSPFACVLFLPSFFPVNVNIVYTQL